MASEVTSLGAHTDLWRPTRAISRPGRRARLAPALSADAQGLGHARNDQARDRARDRPLRRCAHHLRRARFQRVLVPHLLSRREPFTVVSTGTWVIIMAVGGKGQLDPNADMLANVDVRGEPVPTARFMGGREYAVLAGDVAADADEVDVAAVIASGALALPAFSRRGARSPRAKASSKAQRRRRQRRAPRSRLSTRR